MLSEEGARPRKNQRDNKIAAAHDGPPTVPAAAIERLHKKMAHPRAHITSWVESKGLHRKSEYSNDDEGERKSVGLRPLARVPPGHPRKQNERGSPKDLEEHIDVRVAWEALAVLFI